NIDQFSIGSEAISFGAERVAGRQALRAFGVDPDSPQVTQALQNLASMQACVNNATIMRKKVMLSVDFTLAAIEPEHARWYYSTRCGCGAIVPLIEDISIGKYR